MLRRECNPPSANHRQPFRANPTHETLVLLAFLRSELLEASNIVQSLADGLSRRRNANSKPEFDVTLVKKTAAEDFDDGSLPFRVVRAPGFIGLFHLGLA